MNNAANTNKWLPIIYANYYPILRSIAFEHGYALALHGSLVNDMDLIAVPWSDDAEEPLKMLAAMCMALGRHDLGEPFDSQGEKPHGRIAYTIIAGGGGYLDISIMPRIDQATEGGS